MARPALLVDAGALIALANRRDKAHRSVYAFLDSYFGELVTTWPVITEACHLVPEHLSPMIVNWTVTPRWRVLGMEGASARLSALMLKYADRPMDLANASMIWAAEHTSVTQILTTDKTDFQIYRTRTGRRLEVLP